MTSPFRAAAAAFLALAVWGLAAPVPSPGQEVSAEVRTWGGQTLKLAEPSFEAYYTILPAPKEGAGPASGVAASQESAPGTFMGVRVTGSVESLSQFFDAGPKPLQGHRRAEVLGLQRQGTEIRVPVASIATLIFARKPVASALPSYVRGEHYRHGVTAVLIDGSRVEADYVNLGTIVLRGQTGQGRVDIPWHDIEVVRFQR
jgi:hypothetical protein